jgi:hypothetical protein
MVSGHTWLDASIKDCAPVQNSLCQYQFLSTDIIPGVAEQRFGRDKPIMTEEKELDGRENGRACGVKRSKQRGWLDLSEGVHFHHDPLNILGNFQCKTDNLVIARGLAGST